MPKRRDIQSILIIGAGPIVIGQACEFDYSGVQGCRVLKQEGYRIILVNSNPATIMTDPTLADATYIEPVEWQTLARVIELEKPDAMLPTLGGQTALNVAVDLKKEGILEKYGVELIGASIEAIKKAEDRELFRNAMRKIGLQVPQSTLARNMEEAFQAQALIGFPTIIRPSFTLGGSGGGIAYNREEFIEICETGFNLSPTYELLIEESLLGWKEFELEVIRDKKDNCIIVCSIENLDPMGVHTGDSITVAPAQTLTDKEYQRMRDAAIAVLREVGVDTGGSNVQFAVHPETGRLVIIEMNPRVSRSSALASKATGFPIAKVAAKLAVGYTLDELKNEITGGKTPISFEPTIDYVVTKIPRFNFEKFPQTASVLTTQMKSVGEVMAIGRTFQESLQKALRSLETGLSGLDPILEEGTLLPESPKMVQLLSELRTAGPDRILQIADAFRKGLSIETIAKETHIDPWFLREIADLVEEEQALNGCLLINIDKMRLWSLKRKGFSDGRLAKLLGVDEEDIRKLRKKLGVYPVYKRVDTCAAEFETETAYLYSTYEEACEARPTSREKIMILGGGPNRIGQGIEFDYCCVHAALALKEVGYETIMVNCNPETVSTDFDTSDRLYFEPLTLEDVLEIVRIEQPKGVIVQYGGQTPLKLAKQLHRHGVPILGTSPDAIDVAEDRERFAKLVSKLNLLQPQHRTARKFEEGIQLARELGYPIMLRPSYVLGGRAMEVVRSEEELKEYLEAAVSISEDSPVLLDRFLEDAIEVDVDVVSDGKQVWIAGIMEHIEQAGIHSGDSACSLPVHSLSVSIQDTMRDQVRLLAKELGVIGLMNTQFAIQAGQVYLLEVNPRASRTVPFVSKAIGIPLADVAAKCMVGISLKQQNLLHEVIPPYFSVKEVVFPFARFPNVDPLLGPEMKSTGEAMGIGETFAEAFAKAFLGTGAVIKPGGTAFLSVRNKDKSDLIPVARDLLQLGFQIYATQGTMQFLTGRGIPCKHVNKVMQGRPHIVDMIKNGEIHYIVNTVEGRQATADSYTIRRSALQHQVNYTTTVEGARAAVHAMKQGMGARIGRLQDYHQRIRK